MFSKNPMRYVATGALIRPGDVVRVPYRDRTVKAVVKAGQGGDRKVAVWIAQSVLARHRAVIRKFHRDDVTPLPWMGRRSLPFILFDGDA